MAFGFAKHASVLPEGEWAGQGGYVSWFVASADWEIGDTAALETCATVRAADVEGVAGCLRFGKCLNLLRSDDQVIFASGTAKAICPFDLLGV